MRVVLDTNVLLAAFGTRGLCESVLEVCLAGHELIVSEHILNETRTHLTAKFKVPAKQTREMIALLRDRATIVSPKQLPVDVCRDPDDVPVLGTAVAGDADCLVTGDGDLLELGDFRKIPILTPRAFYQSLT
jgi:putative PIN family toxin of toxin-antitoxin system